MNNTELQSKIKELKNYSAQDRLDYIRDNKLLDALVETSKERHAEMKLKAPDVAMNMFPYELLSDKEKQLDFEAKQRMQTNEYRIWKESPAAAQLRLLQRHEQRKKSRALKASKRNV